MKRTAFVGIIFNLLLACSAFGQFRYSIFALDNHYVVDAPVFDSGGVPLEGPGYFAELWGSATPDSLVPAQELRDHLPRVIVPFQTDGYFSAGFGFLAVPSLSTGGFSWLQVRAWDANLGATYEEAVARGLGGYGESALFFADGGDPTLILPELPGPLIGLESFSLRPLVPEPSTWALLILGGVSVCWAARRRWQSFLR